MMSIDWTKFEEVAVLTLSEDKQSVIFTVTNEAIATETEVVYVWRSADKTILRIGSAKNPVVERLRKYEKDINKALRGAKSDTPLTEAESWKKYLSAGPATAIVHRPEKVSTVVGDISPYLNIERRMIKTDRGEFNRSHQ